MKGYGGRKSYGGIGTKGINGGYDFSSGFNRGTLIVYSVWLIVVVIFQPTLIQWISVCGISPDIFLVFVICAALRGGKLSGAVCGFVFGLVLDMMTGRIVGISGITYMYAGFVTGIIKDSIMRSESSISAAVITVGAGIVCGIVYFMAYSLTYGSPGFLYGIVRTVLPKAIYSAVAAFVLAKPIGASLKLADKRSMF